MQKLGMLSHDWTEPCVQQHSKKRKREAAWGVSPFKTTKQKPQKSQPQKHVKPQGCGGRWLSHSRDMAL